MQRCVPATVNAMHVEAAGDCNAPPSTGDETAYCIQGSSYVPKTCGNHGYRRCLLQLTAASGHGHQTPLLSWQERRRPYAGAFMAAACAWRGQTITSTACCVFSHCTRCCCRTRQSGQQSFLQACTQLCGNRPPSGPILSASA